MTSGNYQKYYEKMYRNKAEVYRDEIFCDGREWTAVDMAEDDDKVEKVRAVNVGGTQNIAEACKTVVCKMPYLSTDYVFDGQRTKPWALDCRDYKPLNVYGQSKLEGEFAVSSTLRKCFIVRIAWGFGLNGISLRQRSM